MGREDALAFNRAFYNASPIYRNSRNRARWILPIIMIVCWGVSLSLRSFEWTGTIFYIGVAVLWFTFFPAYYRNHVEKYCAKTIDEGSYSKNFGEYKLSISNDGIHSSSPVGTATYPWSAIDRAEISDTHLFIFLNGPVGYPIPIEEIGSDTAKEAFDYIHQHTNNNSDEQ